MRIRTSIGSALLGFTLLASFAMPGHTASVKHQTVVDLIQLSDVIVSGTVADVTDGFDQNNVPYTEITLTVDECIRGDERGTYVFRQFGLLAPRDMGNGKINLNTTIDGWPQYKQGQEVVLFLYQAAPLTGFRTTVGLLQGKFTAAGGQLANKINNQALFQNVTLDAQVATEAYQKMMESAQGPMNRETFTEFVRKAVGDEWVETGRLSNAGN